MRYAELQCASHFSFLRGASSCEELFGQAAACGIEALAITDRNSLAGIVRAHEAARATGVRLIVGCQLQLIDDTNLLVYPTDRAAYSRLCRLLSIGKCRGGKGRCRLDWEDVAGHAEGQTAILVPDRADGTARRALERTAAIFGPRACLGLTLRRRPRDQMRLHDLSRLAQDMGVPTVVTNDVLYHHPDRRILQDVVTCIREGCTLDTLGFRRERSADRHLKRAAEMHRLFAAYPDALARTLEIADRCRFSLDELSYQYPDEVSEPGLSPQETLAQLTWEGAATRYPDGLPDKVRNSLEHELRLIGALGYAPYFLTVHSIVRFARSQDILCQGRGSAANSAVCFVLGKGAVALDHAVGHHDQPPIRWVVGGRVHRHRTGNAEGNRQIALAMQEAVVDRDVDGLPGSPAHGKGCGAFTTSQRTDKGLGRSGEQGLDGAHTGFVQIVLHGPV